MILNINGKDYETKFSWGFYKNAVENYTDNKNADGFNVFVNDLLNEDPDALVKGYRLAIVDKKKPSADAVAEALTKKGVFAEANPYAEMYGELKADGFLALKLKSLVKQLKTSADNSKIAFNMIKKNGEKVENLRDMKLDTEAAEESYKQVKKEMEDFDKLIANKQ